MDHLERFFNKIMPEPNTGCWLWNASSKVGGYGNFYYIDKIIGSHRASWIIHNGKIPEGLCVLHKCDTPACVNPKHLFLGTNHDNVRDKINKKRQNNQKKTHCIQGHLLSGYNLITYHLKKFNKRQCRTCENIRTKRYYYRKKEVAIGTSAN